MSVAIPDYVEPFEGWRVWRASNDGSQLRLLSVVQETVWPPREELAADCLKRRVLARLGRRRRHEAPAEACACGIYATTLDRLGSYLHDRGDGGAHYVFGRVLLWGTVIECEQGWRAARAYPAEIIVPAPAERAPTGATAEDIAVALSCYAVPIAGLPHTPAEALEVVALERAATVESDSCDERQLDSLPARAVEAAQRSEAAARDVYSARALWPIAAG